MSLRQQLSCLAFYRWAELLFLDRVQNSLFFGAQVNSILKFAIGVRFHELMNCPHEKFPDELEIINRSSNNTYGLIFGRKVKFSEASSDTLAQHNSVPVSRAAACDGNWYSVGYNYNTLPGTLPMN